MRTSYFSLLLQHHMVECKTFIARHDGMQGQHNILSNMQQAEESASCHQDVQQSQAVSIKDAGNQTRGSHDDIHDPETVCSL